MSLHSRHPAENALSESAGTQDARILPALREHAADRAAGDSTVVVSRGQLTRILCAIVGAFVAINAGFLIYRLGFGGRELMLTSSLFSFDSEINLPTFFSVALLLAAAVLCAISGRQESQPEPLMRRCWYLLAIVFAYLAADEAARLHEYLDHLMRRGWVHRGGLQWPWVIPYLVMAGGVATVCTPFLRRLPRAIAWRCMVAGAIYVGGAAGVDMIEGLVSHAVRAGASNLQPLLMALPIIEEPMEMIGVILFIAAILNYLADRKDLIRLRVTR